MLLVLLLGARVSNPKRDRAHFVAVECVFCSLNSRVAEEVAIKVHNSHELCVCVCIELLFAKHFLTSFCVEYIYCETSKNPKWHDRPEWDDTPCATHCIDALWPNSMHL